MNENISIERDVESAYGSDVSSNSRMELKKESFSFQEPAAAKYQLLKLKLREYMILEALFLVILVLILINSYRISSQHQETQVEIAELRTEVTSLQKLVKGDQTSNSNNPKEGTERAEELTASSKFEEARPKLNFNPSDYPLFNAASHVIGATIDVSRSSSSSLNPTSGYDQSNLVLVDRPEPPSDKAWCTYEKEPVITINLIKYITPVAVTYQHSKWNGTIPDEAPRLYDVMACLDYDCEKLEPLVLNCHYTVYGNGVSRQEQRCLTRRNSPLIGKVQFHFRRNQGKVERTCISLVRVESKELQMPKERSMKDAEACSELKYDYHNRPFTYQWFDYKNCTDLYSKNCCEDCPECCEACLIQDWKPKLTPIIIGISLPFVFLFALFICIGMIGICHEMFKRT